METNSPESRNLGVGMSEELLRQYVEGRLNPQQAHFVERHLLESEMWNDIHEGMVALQEDTIPMPDVRGSLENRLQQRIAQEDPIIGKPPRRIGWRKMGMFAASMAGLIAIAGITVKYIGNSSFGSQEGEINAVATDIDKGYFDGETVELRDYSRSSTDFKASGEIPEEINYETGNIKNEVASRKQLASGKAKITFAEVDNAVLSDRGYRELKIVPSKDWKTADLSEAEKYYAERSEPQDPDQLSQAPITSTMNSGVSRDQLEGLKTQTPPPAKKSTPSPERPTVAQVPPATSEPVGEERPDSNLGYADDAYAEAEEVVLAENTEDLEPIESIDQSTVKTDKEEQDRAFARTEQAEEKKRGRKQASEKAESNKLLGFTKSKKALSADVYKANTISGTITDANGDAIIGATVRVIGKDLAAVTDMEGNYELEGVEEGDKISITSIGMEEVTAYAKLNDKDYFVLDQDGDALSEVVVTGYGAKKGKANLKKVFEEVIDAEVAAYQRALSNPQKGKVVYEITIDETGKVLESTLIKGMDNKYNEHALRTIQEAADNGYLNGWTNPQKPFRVKVKY